MKIRWRRSGARLEVGPSTSCQGWGRGFESLRPLQISLERSGGAVFCFPALVCETGEAWGKQQEACRSGRTATFGMGNARSCHNRPLPANARTRCMTCPRRERTCFPTAQDPFGFASPTSSVTAKASSFRSPASLTHRQNKAQRVWQLHEAMRRVKPGRGLVQRVDDHPSTIPRCWHSRMHAATRRQAGSSRGADPAGPWRLPADRAGCN